MEKHPQAITQAIIKQERKISDHPRLLWCEPKVLDQILVKNAPNMT